MMVSTRLVWGGWLLLLGVLTGIGITFALIAVPLAVLGVFVALGAGAGAAIHPQLARWPVLVILAPRRRVAAGVGALAIPMLAGLVVVSGLSGLVALGSLLVSGLLLPWPTDAPSPAGPADPAPHRHAQAPTTPPPATPHIPAAPLQRAEVSAWSDERLCMAWRLSFARLERADEPAERARVVQERRVYLDEIECRDPRGFAAWMNAGVRAASDPGPYLRTEL